MTAAIFLNGALKMGSTSTLTSLAMLKVEIDHGGDYLNYLKPFISQVLYDKKPELITDSGISDLIKEHFGLEIPARTVQIILKRLVKDGALHRESGTFHIKKLENPDISIRKNEAQRHINSVVSGLISYAKKLGHNSLNEEKAVTAICSFLSEFDIPCLKAYLRGTAIPAITTQRPTDIVLVSEYVLHIQEHDLARFDNFIVLLQGHMIANALLCPDLQNAPKTYNGITFYLDTPLLITILKLDDEHKNRATKETITLLKHLGARIAAFAHSREELERVITGAANYIDDPKARGSIVRVARSRELKKSDLLLSASNIDPELQAAGIEIIETPRYVQDFQIDESAFETVLDDEISYFNDRAREYDINSVRSIYVLRGKINPHSLEKCVAALVTSNSAFSRAAYTYGRTHGNSSDVSSVITDFSLANLAWLKAPMGAPEIPTSELLAYAYAAKQPSKHWLEKYIAEIEKLEKTGKISTRDHQLLRSSVLAQDELMKLTLGEESALQEESITQTLNRVTSEIKLEELKNTQQERKLKIEIQQRLEEANTRNRKIEERIYWDCKERAARHSRTITFIINTILIIGAAASIGLTKIFENESNRLLFLFLSTITTVTALYGLIDGFTTNKLKLIIENHLFTKYYSVDHKKYIPSSNEDVPKSSQDG